MRILCAILAVALVAGPASAQVIQAAPGVKPAQTVRPAIKPTIGGASAANIATAGQQDAKAKAEKAAALKAQLDLLRKDQTVLQTQRDSLSAQIAALQGKTDRSDAETKQLEALLDQRSKIAAKLVEIEKKMAEVQAAIVENMK